MRARFALFALPLLVAACGPQMPTAPDNGNTARNVVAKPIKAQPLEVKISLVGTTRPADEVELRAAQAGVIVQMPYDKGDPIKASAVPPATWLTVEEYVERRAATGTPTEEELALRNMAHLIDVPCLAKIDDTALEQSFREAQANYDQAVRDLKRLQEYKETTGSALDQARTRRDTARAAAQRVLAQIKDTRICSPISGEVVERVRQQGEYVNAGELIARVAVLDRIRADLALPEAHYVAVKVGDVFDVTLTEQTGGKPLTREGRVVRKDRVAHAMTHSFNVEIEIDNKDLSLPAGMFATVRVATYKRDDAIVVPWSAIKLNGEQKSLFLLKGDRVKEMRNIKLGQYTQEWAEIIDSGVKPGDRVISTAVHLLSDGDIVNATDKDPAA